MYPDSWIYRGFTSCNFDLWWKQNGGHGNDFRKIHGFKMIIYAQTALIWKFHNAVCTATSTFDKWHDIRCLRAEFTAKHGKAPLSLTTRWWMEPDLGSWQSPDISRSHLYRGTIAWTPTNRDISGLHCIVQRQLQAWTRNISVLGFGATYIRDFMVSIISTLHWSQSWQW